MEYRNGIGVTTPTSVAEGVARRDRIVLQCRRTHGRLRGARGGSFQRFPPSRGGLRSFASPYINRTNRRWAASAAAARPWFARPRQQGMQSHKILKVLTEAAETQARAPPQWGCVERTLGYQTLSDLTTKSIFSDVLSKFVSDVVLTPGSLLVALP